ncbi:MAG: HEAT repeat domain-containing protein [Candidatus Brocadiia bacterium]
MFLRISIILTALLLLGAGVYPVATNTRQCRIKELLIQLLNEDEAVYGKAFNTLINLNVDHAIPELTKLLQDRNPKVRWLAVGILGGIGTKEAIPEITKLLSDPDEDVREAAQAALKELGAEVPGETK